MSHGWSRVALADILEQVVEPEAVEPDGSYPVMGVYGFGRGPFARPAVRGSDISARSLYRVRAGQIVYSRLKAFEGAFGLVGPGLAGRYVSNEFPVFCVNKDLADPAFVALCLGRPTVWHELADLTIGVGARRERLKVEAFLEYEIDLPPLNVQRQILDDVSLIDDAHAALKGEARAANQAYVTALQSMVEDPPFPRVALDDVIEGVDAGKSPQCLDRAPRGDEWGVLKVSAVRSGRFLPDEAKALPAEVRPFTAATVRSGDLLVTRANTRALVGSACLVGGEPRRLLLSDKTLRIRLKDGVNPGYVVHALATRESRAQIADAASGTSDSMKNISQADLRAVEVPLPQDASQAQSITTGLDALRTYALALEEELGATGRLRLAYVETIIAGPRTPAPLPSPAPQTAGAT